MMTAIHTDLMKYSPAHLNARDGRLLKAQDAADAQVWRLSDLIAMAFARFVAPGPVETIAKVERREAARQAVDNLLMR